MKKFRLKNIKFKQVDINQISEKALLANLYFTQAIIFVVGILMVWLQKENDLWSLIQLNGWEFLLWGTLFAAGIVVVDLTISRYVPDDVVDDGGINERMFRNRELWHIAVIAFIVAFCEELLFRGAIQHWIGNYWTSIVFAAIHVRYLRHWLMTGLVFSISYGLGWIYEQTGTLWTPIAAHFFVDFVMGCIIRFRRDN